VLKCSQCESMPSYKWTLTVQSPAGTAGGDGHIDYTSDANWTTAGTIKANFTSNAGREFISAKQVQADQGFTIECPSSAFSRGIQPSWRLTWIEDGSTHKGEILSVVDVNRERKKVQIEVKEHK
jgi:hypothetical protein